MHASRAKDMLGGLSERIRDAAFESAPMHGGISTLQTETCLRHSSKLNLKGRYDRQASCIMGLEPRVKEDWLVIISSRYVYD